MTPRPSILREISQPTNMDWLAEQPKVEGLLARQTKILRP